METLRMCLYNDGQILRLNFLKSTGNPILFIVFQQLYNFRPASNLTDGIKFFIARHLPGAFKHYPKKSPF
jgi:hypothetical protein